MNRRIFSSPDVSGCDSFLKFVTLTVARGCRSNTFTTAVSGWREEDEGGKIKQS